MLQLSFPRTASLAGAGSAIAWGDGLESWPNPAAPAYAEELRFVYAEPTLDGSVPMTAPTRKVLVAGNGFGLTLAWRGLPFANGAWAEVDEFAGGFPLRSRTEDQAIGCAVSLLRILRFRHPSLRGVRGFITRHTDIAVGFVRRETRLSIGPRGSGVEPEFTGRSLRTDVGGLLRVSSGGYGSDGPAAAPRPRLVSDIAVSLVRHGIGEKFFSVTNGSGSIDEASTRCGMAGRAVWSLRADSARDARRWFEPLLDVTCAIDLVRWPKPPGEEAAGSRQRHMALSGVELAVGSVLVGRWGRRTSDHYRENSHGYGLRLPLASAGYISYEVGEYSGAYGPFRAVTLSARLH